MHCSAMGKRTSALITDGNLWVWGENSRGQLGTGDRTNRSVPTLLSKLKDEVMVEVALGPFHSLALNDLGEVGAGGW